MLDTQEEIEEEVPKEIPQELVEIKLNDYVFQPSLAIIGCRDSLLWAGM